MPHLSSIQIVDAFDETLDFVFGRSRGRDYPAKEDHEYANAWIAEGLTLTIAVCVFYHRMSSMHEYWMRQANHKDNKNIPSTLKFFDENIRAGIARHKAGGEPIAVWEQSESQWRSRLISWVKEPKFWQQRIDQWGSEPFHPDTRAPQRLIKEIVPPVMLEERRKTASNK